VSNSPEPVNHLLRALTAAVEACWLDGSPVAGQNAVAWERTARVALRRIRSFARRSVSESDRRCQIRDIAQGFVAAFEPHPKLVGPLLVDYKHVAEKVLEAFHKGARAERDPHLDAAQPGPKEIGDISKRGNGT
jgi:hypothetical protein